MQSDKYKQLLNAGFPFRRATKFDRIDEIYKIEIDGKLYYKPSLSEFVIACGGRDAGWRLEGDKITGEFGVIENPDPEEAFTELYLKLS